MCVLGGFEKSVRSRGGRKMWLKHLGPDYISRTGSFCRDPGTLANPGILAP